MFGYYRDVGYIMHGSSGGVVYIHTPSGPPPQTRDEQNLLRAARSGSVDMVKELLSKDVKQTPERWHSWEVYDTPLHAACQRLFSKDWEMMNTREIINLLVDKDPEALKWTKQSTCSYDGHRGMQPTTPIHYAIEKTDPNDKTSVDFLRQLVQKAKFRGVEVIDERAEVMLQNTKLEHILENIPEDFASNCAMWNPTPGEPYTIKGVGSFYLMGKIGQGAFGTVFKAREVGTTHFRAIKMLHSTKDEEDKIHQRIREHGGHENVVQSYGSGRLFGKTWIVMELIDGVQSGAIAWTDDLQMQYRKAMHWLAEIGVNFMARENERENIMVRTDSEGKPQAVVLDFGTDTDYPASLTDHPAMFRV